MPTQKILDALEALCRACPDIVGLAVDLNEPYQPRFTIKCGTEETAYRLAEQFGVAIERRHSNEGKNDTSWLAAYGRVTIYGPHMPWTPPGEVSEEKIDAAVKQAEEAALDGKGSNV